MIFGEGPIIKNIAGDLNKLFLQGSRVGQPITNVEGDAAADQGTIQLMADRDPVIRDISTGLGYETPPGREVTVSGTGALQLVNSLGRPLKNWSVELAPYQEGSGDPSPENVRPIHGTNKLIINTGGKNWVNPANYDWQTRTQNGLTYTVQSDGSIKVTGTSTTVGGPGLSSRFQLPPGTYYGNVSSTGTGLTVLYRYAMQETGGTTYPLSNPFVSDGTQWYYINLYCSQTGVTYDNVLYPQIELGTSFTEFTPYITPTQTEINLPQAVYTGTVGSDDGEILWGEADLGTLKWTYITNDGEPYFSAYVNETAPSGYEKMPGLNQICSCYKTASSTGTGSLRDMEIGASGSNNSRIFVKDSRFTDLPSFISFVTGKQFVYQLETSTEFGFTTPTIPTAEGDGSAWGTVEDGIITNFSVTYIQPE